ncbi:TPA: hypothetical protein QCV70_002483 [Bacillus cereus]|nr:hypothetical protein [Bacillus cereus]
MDKEKVKALLENSLAEINNGITDGEALGELKQTLDDYEALEKGRELMAIGKAAQALRITDNSPKNANDEAGAQDLADFANQNRITKK